MRNLKKVLSLALVFVMVFALMVSAGAAYSDQSKIENKEAVEMVTALKIMQGRNGAFDPTAPVQRGELAKMLYVASTGSDDGAVLYASYQNKFTDVPNTVAEYWGVNYIKWAAFKGVVSGKSPTMFYPKDSVLGVEALKMALTALGYDSKVEGYQDNADWQMNIASRAQDLGLLKDIPYDCLNRAMTRDEAAQLIYNMLNSFRVVYRTNSTNDDRPVVVKRDDDGINMMEAVFSVAHATGILVKTPTATLDGLAAKDKVVVYPAKADGTYDKYTTDAASNLTFTGSVDDALLGHEVSVYYKKDSGTYTKKDIYGIFDTGVSKTVAPNEVPTRPAPNADNLVSVKDGKIDTVTAATAVVLRTVDGVIYKDFEIQKTSSLGFATVKDVKATSTNAAYTSIAVSEGKASGGSLIFSAIDVKNVTGADSIADKDVVVVTKQWISGSDYKYTVTKAETITGAITAVGNDGKVTINGTKYAVFTGTGKDTIDSALLNQTGTFYLVNGAVAAFKADVVATDNYALVTAAQDKSDDVFNPISAKVIASLDNGTTDTFEVESAVGVDDLTQLKSGGSSPYKDAAIATPVLAKYALTAEGKIVLGAVQTATSGTTDAKYVGGSKLTVGGTALIVDDQTVFFVKDGSKYAAYVGRSKAPAFDASTSINYLAADGKAKVVILATVPNTSAETVGYVLSYGTSKTSDNKLFYTVEMFDGANTVTYETVTSVTGGTSIDGITMAIGFQTYTMESGKIKTMVAASTTDGKVTAYSAGEYIKIEAALYELSSDCKLWTVENGAVTEGADLVADASAGTVIKAIVPTSGDNQGKVTAIYVVK